MRRGVVEEGCARIDLGDTGEGEEGLRGRGKK